MQTIEKALLRVSFSIYDKTQVGKSLKFLFSSVDKKPLFGSVDLFLNNRRRVLP